MKLRREDTVIVIAGRDRGKKGKVLAVLPASNQVVVENINVAKRHTKPTDKNPRGGIIPITKPINAAKVMVVDPATGKPARIGYEIKPDGSKERVFKVSPNHEKQAKKAEKKVKKADDKTAKDTDKPKAEAKPKTGKSK